MANSPTLSSDDSGACLSTEDTPVSSDTHVSKDDQLVSVKLIFRLQNTESINDAKKKHFATLKAIEDTSPDVILFDHHSNHIIPSKLQANDFNAKFEYEQLPRRHIKLVAVSHAIQSSISLSDIKSNIHTLLSTQRITLSINTWPTLDVRDIGWLYGVHHQFHNRDELSDFLTDSLKKYNKLDTLPPFRLYVKSVTNGKPSSPDRISTPAVHIECKSENIHELRELLNGLYATKSRYLPGKFIPMNLQHIDDTNLYRKYINGHKQYLVNHRNISLFHLGHDDVQEHIMYKGKQVPILSILEKSSSISWISSPPTPGKWNLSTTIHHYSFAVKTIQSLVLDRFPHVKSNIISNPASVTSPSVISTTTKSYLEILTTGSSTFPITTIPAQTSNSNSTHPSTSPSNISSLAASASRAELQQLTSSVTNLKEHVDTNISSIKSELNNLKIQLQKEIQNLIRSSIKEMFHEMKISSTSLQETISNEIRSVVSKTIQSMSPNKRQTKRSRIPNTDPNDTTDEEFEISNRLFEENMTVRPDSPMAEDPMSLEEQLTNQP